MPKSTTEPTAPTMPSAMAEMLGYTDALSAYNRDRYLAAIEQARADKLDEAPEGGRYIVAGRVVDANGNPVEGEPG